MIILSIPTMTPAVKDVNHNFAASFSMLVTSSTPVCSIVASIRLGSDDIRLRLQVRVHRVTHMDELLNFLEPVRYL